MKKTGAIVSAVLFFSIPLTTFANGLEEEADLPVEPIFEAGYHVT